MKTIVSIIAAAVMVVACSGGTATESMTATPEPTAVTTTPEATVTVGLVAKPRSIKDPKGDLVDENGKKVGKNGRIDVLKLTAAADGTDLQLTLELAANVPAKLSSLGDQETTYLFQVETDDSGGYDYWLTLDNIEAGGWIPSISDYTQSGGGTSAFADRFPGMATVHDNIVMVTVALSALGFPAKVRIAATSQRADHVSGKVLAQDDSPKGSMTGGPSKAWLALGG